MDSFINYLAQNYFNQGFNLTFDAVMSVLTDEAKEYLTAVYGDLTAYITNKIEAEVNISKIIPLYSNIPPCFRKAFKYIGHIYVTLSWRKEYCGVFEYDYEGIKYYFIDKFFIVQNIYQPLFYKIVELCKLCRIYLQL